MATGELHRLMRPALLLCEGKDEERLALRLLRDLVPEFQVHDCGGESRVEKVIVGLPLAVGISDLTHLVILRDAEENSEIRRRGTERALERAAIGSSVRVQIIVVPEDHTEGALEDVLFADHAPTPVQTCINQMLECAARHGHGPQTPGQRAKSRLRSWLALAAPSRNPAHHIHDGVLDLQAPGLQRLRQRILAVMDA